jgi:hypothetical protein
LHRGANKTIIILRQDRQSSSQSLNFGLSKREAGVLISDDDMKLEGTRKIYQKVCFQTAEKTRM